MVLLHQTKQKLFFNDLRRWAQCCIPSVSMQTPPASLTINVPAAEINFIIKMNQIYQNQENSITNVPNVNSVFKVTVAATRGNGRHVQRGASHSS